MRIISFEETANLNIKPESCIQWAEEVIKNKNRYVLPPKIGIPFGNSSNSFFNTMPCLIPDKNRFGVKVVSRLPERMPALKADILLYDTSSGDLLAVMDGTWITTMRTGAVAAITVNKLKAKRTDSYSFIGLGNTARATLLCLNILLNRIDFNVNILAYKNQHNDFINRFSDYRNIRFFTYHDTEEMIKHSDVIISCVTVANSVFAAADVYKKGVLVVPVHTKGFQNCDLEFDKIFCDDINHVRGFKYFNEYKYLKEMSEILNDTNFVREETDRLLAYNIGIAAQDIFFASKIFDMVEKQDSKLKDKFWV